MRDQPELGPATAAGDGVGGANGRVGAAAADPAHAGPLPEATFPELIGRLINDVSDLADRQIELAKQEVGEAKGEIVGIVGGIGIGVGIGVAAAVLLVIWAWTAFIWFFNWLGAAWWVETPIGSLPVFASLGVIGGVAGGAWVGYRIARAVSLGLVLTALAVIFPAIVLGALALAGLGWLMGILVPAVAATFAVTRFILGGIRKAKTLWPPLPRTRATLKEDLAWVQHLRTRNGR
jgi:Putative Actinobacterial Holin-X, holin superfamily III